MFIYNKINLSLKLLIALTIVSEIIFFLRTGLVYSYPNDQIWHHYFLYLKDLSGNLDLLSYAKSDERSLWFFLVGKFSKIIEPITLYYLFILIQNFFFFFICFLIFNSLTEKKNLFSYILFGLIISSNSIIFSGSLSTFHEISFTYRSTGYTLMLLSIYFLIEKKVYLSIIISFIGSMMHLPVTVPFYIYFITLFFFKKFHLKQNLLFFFSTLVLFFFNINHSSFLHANEYLEIAKKLMFLRQSYLFIENWSYDHIFRYILFYICFATMCFMVNKNFKKFCITLFIFHLFYFIFVLFTYKYPIFSVFKLGRELPFVFLVLVTTAINFCDEKKVGIIILTSLFSIILFSSMTIYLILFFYVLISKKKNINYIFSKLCLK